MQGVTTRVSPTVTPIARILAQVGNSFADERVELTLNACFEAFALLRIEPNAHHELRLHLIVAKTYCITGAHCYARDHLAQAFSLARILGDDRTLAELCALMSTVLVRLGQRESAQKYGQEAIQRAKALRDARVTAIVADYIARDLAAKSEYGAALQLVEHGLTITQYMESFQGRSSLLCVAAQIAISQSRWIDAENYLNAATIALSRFPSKRLALECRLMRCKVLSMSQGTTDALRDAEGLPDEFLRIELPHRSLSAATLLLSIAIEEERMEVARQMLAAVNSANYALLQQQQIVYARVEAGYLCMRSTAQLVPALRKELLALELRQLGLQLELKSRPIAANSPLMALPGAAKVVCEVEDAILHTPRSITVVRLEILRPALCNNQKAAMLDSLSSTLTQGVGARVRQIKLTDNHAYYVIAGSALSRVVKCLSKVCAAIDASTLDNCTAHLSRKREYKQSPYEVDYTISAVLRGNSYLGSVFDLLCRLDTIAKRQRAGLEPAICVRRLR